MVQAVNHRTGVQLEIRMPAQIENGKLDRSLDGSIRHEVAPILRDDFSGAGIEVVKLRRNRSRLARQGQRQARALLRRRRERIRADSSVDFDVRPLFPEVHSGRSFNHVTNQLSKLDPAIPAVWIARRQYKQKALFPGPLSRSSQVSTMDRPATSRRWANPELRSLVEQSCSQSELRTYSPMRR